MKSRLSPALFVATVILAMTQLFFAQSSPITEEEYWKAVRTAYGSSRKVFPRRETESYEAMLEGKGTFLRTEVYEYVSGDTYRSIQTVIRDGTKTTSEAIQLGAKRYCRENLNEWASVGCYMQPPAPLGSADETHFSVEVGKQTKTYIRTAKKQEIEKGKSEPTTFLTEDRLVVNMDSSARERSIVRFKGASKAVVSKGTKKIEYNAKIVSIEVPVK